jgi:hypothetical protein
VNPDDLPEEQCTFEADPEWLLDQLDRFARTGTFAIPVDLRPLLARQIDKLVREKNPGATWADRTQAVEDALGASRSTAERLLDLRKRNAKKQ